MDSDDSSPFPEVSSSFSYPRFIAACLLKDYYQSWLHITVHPHTCSHLICLPATLTCPDFRVSVISLLPRHDAHTICFRRPISLDIHPLLQVCQCAQIIGNWLPYLHRSPSSATVSIDCRFFRFSQTRSYSFASQLHNWFANTQSVLSIN